VESESLFNDGVAAVLFGLALAYVDSSNASAWSAGWDLLRISGDGIALGLGVGGAAIIIAGRTGEHMVEAAVTGVAAYRPSLRPKRCMSQVYWPPSARGC
jgi:CPA1 family monovalent cation:H+ antiporter